MKNKNNVKSKGKSKRKRFKIGGFILLMFLLLYIPSMLHWMSGRNISTDILRIGIIEDLINVDGIIIRNEKVYKAPFEGKYIPEAGEGEKVAAGSRVATVMKSTSLQLLDELEDYNQRIIRTQVEKNKNREIFSEDIAKLDNEIGRKLKLVVDETSKNSFAKIAQLKLDVDNLVQKKAEIYGGQSTADVHINQLKNERDKLQDRIKANTKGEVSESSGIVSYIIDGLEEELNPSIIKKLNVKYLEGLKIPATAASINMRNTRDTVMGKPFVKVIDSKECYIAIAVKADKAGMFKVGMEPKVRIYDIGKEIKGIVKHISEEDGGKVIIVVGIDRSIDETTNFRKINIDLIRSSQEGFKVPVRSLRDIDRENNKAQIVLVKANYASVQEVKIAAVSDEYAIIKNIDDSGKKGVSLYDSYIIDPQNIEEGQIINK